MFDALFEVNLQTGYILNVPKLVSTSGRSILLTKTTGNGQLPCRNGRSKQRIRSLERVGQWHDILLHVRHVLFKNDVTARRTSPKGGTDTCISLKVNTHLQIALELVYLCPVYHAESVNGKKIRLTDERWVHIVEGHPEMAGYLSEVLTCLSMPEKVLKGANNELLATTSLRPDKVLVVVYKELVEDGFVLTAFFTRHLKQLAKREIVWPK